MVFSFEAVLAEICESGWGAGQLVNKIRGGDELLTEMFHQCLHAKNGIHGIPNDSCIALSDEANIATGDNTIVQGDGDAEGTVGFRPVFGGGFHEKIFRHLKGLGSTRAGVRIHPIGEEGIPEKLVDGATGLLNHVARIAEPLAQEAREDRLFQFFRHGGKPPDIAYEDRGLCNLLADAVRARGECGIVARFSSRSFMLLEDDLAVGDADPGPVVEGARGDDPPSVEECAIAAAKIHHLVLKGIVAADDGMLARDMRTAREADGVIATSPDGGGVAHFHFKRLPVAGADSQTGLHSENLCGIPPGIAIARRVPELGKKTILFSHGDDQVCSNPRGLCAEVGPVPRLHGGSGHDSQKAMKMLSALLAVLFLISLPAHADELMRSVQQKLQAQGFYSGSIDGQYGSQTAAAIRRYQVAEGLQVTGELNPQTLSNLGLVPRGQKSAPEPEYVAIAQIFKGGPYITAPTELQIATIRQAQKTLKLLGYYGGPINGRPDARLVTALKAWQKSAGFRQTGRFDESTLKGLDVMPD